MKFKDKFVDLFYNVTFNYVYLNIYLNIKNPDKVYCYGGHEISKAISKAKKLIDTYNISVKIDTIYKSKVISLLLTSDNITNRKYINNLFSLIAANFLNRETYEAVGDIIYNEHLTNKGHPPVFQLKGK